MYTRLDHPDTVDTKQSIICITAELAFFQNIRYILA